MVPQNADSQLIATEPLPRATVVTPVDTTPVSDLDWQDAGERTDGRRFSLLGLWRFRWSILLVFILLGALGIGGVFSAVAPEYEATAIIEVSPVIPQLLATKSDMVPLYESYRGSQADYIRNAVVLNGVLDDPKIRETNWYQNKPATLLDGLLDRAGLRPTRPPIDRLANELSADVPKGKQLIFVRMNAMKAGEARLLVDAVLREYVRFANERSSASDNDVMVKLRKEIGDREAELRGIEATAAQIRQQLGTGSPEDLVKQRAIDLLRLESSVTSLKTEIEVSRRTLELMEQGGAKAASAEGTASSADGEDAAAPEVEQLDIPPQYARDSRWQQLSDRVKGARRDVQRRAARFGEADPQLAELRSAQREAEDELHRWEQLIDANVLTAGGAVAGAAPVAGSPAALRESIRQMSVRLEELTQQLAEQREQTRSVFTDAERLAQKNAEHEKAEELRQQLQRRLEELRMNREVAGSVRTYPAVEPADPSEDKRLKFAGVALAGALALSVGLAFLRMKLSPTVDHAMEVTGAAQRSMLGGMPLMLQSGSGPEDDPAMQWEAVRLIRTALLNRLTGTRGAAVQVTSATVGSGKSTFSTLLAQSLAHGGKRVLLVDADLRRPVIAKRMSLNSGPGLRELLQDASLEPMAIQRTSSPMLTIVSAGGALQPGDLERLADGALDRLLEKWRGEYDVVLLDGAPILGPADAAIIASRVDGTILIIRERHCRREAVMESLDVLGAAGGKLLGTVFVGSASARGYRYKYGYGYGYGYGGSYSHGDITVPAAGDKDAAADPRSAS